MNRYPNFIDPTCSSFGEYEVIDTPSWFLRIGTAVVVVGVGFCLLMLAGCDLPQERLVCQNIDGRVTYRSHPANDWRLSSTGAWVDTGSSAYRQNAFESCHTERVQ